MKKHLKVEEVKKNGELVAGGDIRRKRNSWFRAAFEDAPSRKSILSVVQQINQDLKICPYGLDTEAWASADKLNAMMERLVRSCQSKNRAKTGSAATPEASVAVNPDNLETQVIEEPDIEDLLKELCKENGLDYNAEGVEAGMYIWIM
ncbi:unnamed protein product [Symbiodinium sp. CCMP2592]|nr:unnamed protein product [Symbiodinium sp. CCMP2592]